MPMLDNIAHLFSRPRKAEVPAIAAAGLAEPQSRLERMVARQHQPKAAPSFEERLDAMEGECSRPLYHPSVYNSLDQGAAGD